MGEALPQPDDGRVRYRYPALLRNGRFRRRRYSGNRRTGRETTQKTRQPFIVEQALQIEFLAKLLSKATPFRGSAINPSFTISTLNGFNLGNHSHAYIIDHFVFQRFKMCA